MIPEPLTPAECDLSGLEYMPLLGVQLFGSDFNMRASDSEWRAGLTLWWAAWQQVPAASLPDDDVALCRLADLGRDLKSWRKLRTGALHGWVKCSDGRLYNPTLAKQALIAWDKRVKERERKAAWRAKKTGQEQSGDADVPWDGNRMSRGTERGRDADVPADETRRDGTGRDDIKEEDVGERGREAAAPPTDPSPDLLALNAEACRTAGVKRISPTAVAANLDLIREWTGDGATPDEILTTIAAQVSAATEPIHSLRYFAPAIRQTVARRENLANGRSLATSPALRAEPGSLRGSRPDPALDLLRAAREAERTSDDRSADWGDGRPFQAIS